MRAWHLMDHHWHGKNGTLESSLQVIEMTLANCSKTVYRQCLTWWRCLQIKGQAITISIWAEWPVHCASLIPLLFEKSLTWKWWGKRTNDKMGANIWSRHNEAMVQSHRVWSWWIAILSCLPLKWNKITLKIIAFLSWLASGVPISH